MRLTLPAAVWGVASAILLGAAGAAAAPVEYVRVCDAFGTGFFYVPGTDTCLHAETGEERTVRADGLHRKDSALAARVRALESDYCDECFTVVAADGGGVSSNGLRSVKRTAVGSYEAVFDKSAGKCAMNATLTHGRGEPVPGMIAVSGSDTNDRAVLIRTYNATGTLTDRRFSLSLECKPKRPFQQFFPGR